MDIGLGTTVTTLDSRYTETGAPVLLTGIQALVRLLLEQARLIAMPGCAPGAWFPATAARRWAGSIRNSGASRSG